MDAREFTRKIISYLASLLASFYGLFRQPENGFQKYILFVFMLLQIILRCFSIAGTLFAIYPASTMQMPKELQPITLVVAGSSPVSADLGFRFNGRVAQLVEHDISSSLVATCAPFGRMQVGLQVDARRKPCLQNADVRVQAPMACKRYGGIFNQPI